MAEGAPDHHLPLETKLDDVITSLTNVKTSIDNLKTTLTNLNIMPPVAETPWAMKYIGKAGFEFVLAHAIWPAEKETVLELTGSGQILAIITHTYSADQYGRERSYIWITVDDIEVFAGYVYYIFAEFASVGTPAFGLSGVAANADDRWVMYYNVPIYYSSSVKIEWKNMSSTDISVVGHFISYTNLP